MQVADIMTKVKHVHLHKWCRLHHAIAALEDQCGKAQASTDRPKVEETFAEHKALPRLVGLP
eukprot:11445912-Karenia_brevis.AAC.1